MRKKITHRNKIFDDDGTGNVPNEQIEKYIKQMMTEPEYYEPFTKLNSLPAGDSKIRKKIFMFPGIEGFPIIFESLASHMDLEVYGMPLDYTTYHETIEDTAAAFLTPLLAYLSDKTFNFVGYSYGGLIAMEVVRLLENLGYNGNLVLVDTSPKMIRKMAEKDYSDKLDNVAQINLILRLLDYIGATKIKAVAKERLKNIPDWNSKVVYIQREFKSLKIPLSETFVRQIFHAVFCRILSIYGLKEFPQKCFSSKVLLIRPSERLVTLSNDDYELSQYCQNEVPEYYVEGTHVTILYNPRMATTITELINHQEPSSD